MLKLIGAAAVVASLVVPCPSKAHEADWLYFPMYERDTAHAVDLKALRFRPDGLLASGTRYPRTGEARWTPEQSERGWYEYLPRLIDCETGFFVDTAISLLDQEGKTIALQPYSLDEQRQDLDRQLQERGTRPWPDNSETLLACAAASSPTLMAERARKARVPTPLISFVPLVQGLKADSDALFISTRQRYDLDAVAKRKPATARAVFEPLQSQHQQWRRRIAGPAGARPGLAPEPLAAVQARFDALSQRAGVSATDRVRLLPRNTVQYQDQATVRLAELSPAEAIRVESTSEISETVLGDCDSGLRIPLAQQWRDQEQKVLLTRPVPPALALAEARDQWRRWESAEGWDLRSGARADGSRLGTICTLAAQLASGANAQEVLDGLAQIDLSQHFEASAEARAAERSPEAMLLNVRAAVRAYRP